MTMKIGNQTERIGMRCLGSIWEKYAGNPPSRDQAQVSREAEATLPIEQAIVTIMLQPTIAEPAVTD